MARTLPVGQEHEFLEAVEAAGLNSKLAQAVVASKDNILAQKLVAWLVDVLKSIFSLVATFDRDMAKEGWKLVEDVDAKDGEFGIDDLELAEFLKDESYVVGEEMLTRAKAMGKSLGQRHAEAMLRNQEAIPEEWRKYVLVFTGSVWLGQGGHRCVACLVWDGDRWYLRFRWLDGHFHGCCRLVRPRKC